MLNTAIAGLTLRQALAHRRWIIVGTLAVLPVLMTLILAGMSDASSDERLQIMGSGVSTLIFTVVVPIIALIVATSSFGSEVDDGTVIFLLVKPIARSEVVFAKLTVVAAISLVFGVASTLASGVVLLGGLDSTRLTVGLAAGAALGSILYSALFLALGLVARRGLLIGLTYLVVWEGALGRLFSGTRTLSVRQYMMSLADAITTVPISVFSAQLPSKTASVMSLVVGVGAVAFCVLRLRRFEVEHSR